MKLKQSIRRKILQFIAFGATNVHLANFASGRLYTGKWKQFCAPGLNCYSCPAASLACPIGAMQAVNGSVKFDFSFYVTGIVLALGVLFGRAICAFLCPFGLVQELINKIPSKKLRLPKPFTYIKYAVLMIFVIILPVTVTNYLGMGKPAFCEFICPSGTLFGGIPMLLSHPELRGSIGALFYLKLAVLAAVIVGSVFVYRFFCKTLCPLGAIYGLLNKVSFYRLRVDESRCTDCGNCARNCRMNVDPVRNADSAECIRCGECAAACPAKAISIGFAAKHGRKD